LIYGFLGRKGFEEQAREGEALLKKENRKYIF